MLLILGGNRSTGRHFICAAVAKLADAPDLESGGSLRQETTPVRVQTPPAVPILDLLYPKWPPKRQPFPFGCLESCVCALCIRDFAVVVAEIELV